MGQEATGCAERELRIELPSEPESVALARHAVGEFVTDHGLDDADIRLAVSEAVSNVVTHAFRDRVPGKVTVSCLADGDTLAIVVADDGGGMRPNLESPGLGLGIPLITKLADEVRFDSSDGGTTVSMSFAA